MVPNTSPIVSVRVSPAERDLLQAAAEQARTSLSDFVRRKALEAAEMDVLEHRVVTIPAQDWGKVRGLGQRATKGRPRAASACF